MVVSRFYPDISEGLLAGANRALSEAGVEKESVQVVTVPGAFEIPLAARRMAASETVDAVICLGCLVKGETLHFEYIADTVARGISQVSADTGIPVTFGVLTTLNLAQAQARSRNDKANKGFEAAAAALQMAAELRRINVAATQ